MRLSLEIKFLAPKDCVAIAKKHVRWRLKGGPYKDKFNCTTACFIRCLLEVAIGLEQDNRECNQV